MKELKKYKLRAARKPQNHKLLSGVVHVCDEHGRRPSYISFSEEFVDAVGFALPMGLLPSNPAYIKILHMPGRGVWRVFAMYFQSSHGALLWETTDLPQWAIPALKSISKKQPASTA